MNEITVPAPGGHVRGGVPVRLRPGRWHRDGREVPGLREQGEQGHRVGPGQRGCRGWLAGGINLFGQRAQPRPVGGEPAQQRRCLAVLPGRGIELL